MKATKFVGCGMRVLPVRVGSLFHNRSPAVHRLLDEAAVLRKARTAHESPAIHTSETASSSWCPGRAHEALRVKRGPFSMRSLHAGLVQAYQRGGRKRTEKHLGIWNLEGHHEIRQNESVLERAESRSPSDAL